MMKFGLFQNGSRDADSATKFERDLQEIVAAEQAGFEEAWISEHDKGTSVVELLVAKASALTNTIRMGPAVRRVALYQQPQLLAIEAAMCDQLTRGRYQFAFGVTPAQANWGPWAVDIAESEGRTLEAIQFMRRIWSEPEPFDFSGRFFSGRNVQLFPRPFHPIPIAIATTRANFLEMAAAENFRVLTIWSAGVDGINKLGATFDQACLRHQGVARRENLAISRIIHVGKTDRQAHDSVEKVIRAQFESVQLFIAKGVESGKVSSNAVNAAFGISTGPGGGRPGMTYDQLVDEGNIVIGSPETVIGSIKKTYERIGGFGTLLLVGGNDWGSPEMTARMYKLFAEAVAPELAKLGHRETVAKAG